MLDNVVTGVASGVRSCYHPPSSKFLVALGALKLTHPPSPKAFTRDGTLIAHFSQEGVVRARVYGPEKLGEKESKL